MSTPLPLSTWAKNISPSPTLAIDAKAKAEARLIEAEAEAKALAMKAEAEAKAVAIVGVAITKLGAECKDNPAAQILCGKMFDAKTVESANNPYVFFGCPPPQPTLPMPVQSSMQSN